MRNVLKAIRISQKKLLLGGQNEKYIEGYHENISKEAIVWFICCH